MFYPDHEKLIYSPAGSDLKFDPLAVLNRLTVVSKGRLADLIADFNARGECRQAREDAPTTGVPPYSPEQEREAAVCTAAAELALAPIAREVFGLPPFPDCTDAGALEVLIDYLGWMEGKGARGSAPPPSPGGSA